MHLFSEVVHLLIRACLWESCEAVSKAVLKSKYFKVFQYFSPVCGNHYSVTGREEIIFTWFVLDCYLSHCYFLGAYTLIIPFSFFPKKEECQHCISFIFWNISLSSVSSQWQLLMLLRLFKYFFFTREWNSLVPTDVKTANLPKYFLI